jgi:hypothetical protein
LPAASSRNSTVAALWKSTVRATRMALSNIAPRMAGVTAGDGDSSTSF